MLSCFSYLTVTVILTLFLAVANAEAPTLDTANPSASEGLGVTSTIWPASSDLLKPGHCSDSTPYNNWLIHNYWVVYGYTCTVLLNKWQSTCVHIQCMLW